MLQFLVGFTLGNVVGMYLAQNYDMNSNVNGTKPSTSIIKIMSMLGALTGVGDPRAQIPNIAKKLEEFKKDVEAKKKPPNDKS